MTEQFDNLFHKKYVGGEGEIEESLLVTENPPKFSRQTLEEIRDHYRKYIKDPLAELPEAVLADLQRLGKIPS